MTKNSQKKKNNKKKTDVKYKIIFEQVNKLMRSPFLNNA